jgi:hypothetical protein
LEQGLAWELPDTQPRLAPEAPQPISKHACSSVSFLNLVSTQQAILASCVLGDVIPQS